MAKETPLDDIIGQIIINVGEDSDSENSFSESSSEDKLSVMMNYNSSTPQTIITSVVYPHQEGTSPPEAAVEATPETTPIKDLRMLSSRPVPPNSSVVRALTNFSAPKWGDLGSQSQPSSPMKKDTSSAFKFPSELSQHTSSAFEQPRKEASSVSSYIDHHHTKFDSFTAQRVSRLMHDRNLMNESSLADRTGFSLLSKTPLNHPTSPLRVIGTLDSSVPNSPVQIETTAPTPGAKDWHVAKPKPEKNGFRFESPNTTATTSSSLADNNISQEDQEVVEIVRRGEQNRFSNNSDMIQHPSNHHCDSVLQDFHLAHNEEFEECEQQLGSSCTLGGLHMPNSQSMIHLAKRLRKRFYSQCVTDTSPADNEFSTGSSPNDRVTVIDNSRVRRTKSYPEMSFPMLPTSSLNKNKVLNETTEEENNTLTTNSDEKTNNTWAVNGDITDRAQYNTIGVQTVDVWPQPYEHMLLELFPSTGAETQTVDTQTSAGPSPAPSSQQNNPPIGGGGVRFSPYEMLDKFIETTRQINDKESSKRMKHTEAEVKSLKEQLELVYLHVQFERHRRYVHSERNRRLMGKAKNNRALEEYNIALRDQLFLLEKEIEKLRSQLENKNKETTVTEKKLQDGIEHWQKQCTSLQEENKSLKHQKETLEEALKAQNNKVIAVNAECQLAEAALLDLKNEMHFAMTQAMAGEQIRADLEQLQKEHLLLGELQLKYQERLASLPNSKCRDEDTQLLIEAYTLESENLNQQLQKSNSIIESLKVRNSDFENAISKHDEMCAEQKRMLKVIKEEYQEELKAVEEKYKAQRAIIKRMEENILELHTRIDRFEYISRRVMRSPVSMSSGRDIGSGERAGPSPHSSPPLSVSLTSSEGGGSMAFLQTSATASSVPTDVEIKNLQVIVDQPEHQTSANDSDKEPAAGTSQQTD